MNSRKTLLVIGCACLVFVVFYNGFFGSSQAGETKTNTNNQYAADTQEDIVDMLADIEYIADLDELFYCISQVESGGNDNAIGDGGEAIGPFQIHYDYWYDAVEYSQDPSIKDGSYKDCFDYNYAFSIVFEYMDRYVPDALYNLDAEVISKTHNGGPRGVEKQTTQIFWNKVKETLDERGVFIGSDSQYSVRYWQF